jgi:hypothetical protein
MHSGANQAADKTPPEQIRRLIKPRSHETELNGGSVEYRSVVSRVLTFPRDFINTRIQAAGIGGDLETVMAWLCDGSEEGRVDARCVRSHSVTVGRFTCTTSLR